MPKICIHVLKHYYPQTLGGFQNGSSQQAEKCHLLYKFNEMEKSFIRVGKSSRKQTSVFTTHLTPTPKWDHVGGTEDSVYSS